MKTLRYCLTSLLLLMNTLMALATDDIIVNINPVQPVLPPQLGAYVSNPGAYFNVTVTNTTSKQAFIYFGMTLAKMPNTTDPLVIVPGNRMPKMPTVALASNETRQLNLTEMRQMFNHLNASDIVTRLDYSSGFESGQFGLLEEGDYRLQLNVYKWNVDGTTDIQLNGESAVATNGKNSCQFSVRYKVDAPKFVTPMRPMGTTLESLQGVAKLNPINPMFAWTESMLGGARPVHFNYDFKVVEVGPDQDPEDAWAHETHVLYKKDNLTSATAVIPQNVIRMMDKSCTYAARVTAKQRTQVTSNNMNFTLVANEGKSDLMVFRLQADDVPAPPTPTEEQKPETNDEPEDSLVLKFGFKEKEGALTDSLYNFRNPEILSPAFSEDAGARKVFVSDDIFVEWKRVWFVGGSGARQDSVRFSYDVELFRGDPSLSYEENFKQEPVYRHTTEELQDSISWEQINGDVSIGDYLLLRVKPKALNVQSVAFIDDSLNVRDFALSDRISKKFFQCSSQVTIENTTPTNKSASDLKGKVVGIGQYQLTLDELAKSKQGFKGRGRVEWRPLGLKVMVAVEFDSLCINTDDIVYSGIVRGRKDDNYYGHNGEQVDQLFSEWGLDNLVSDTRLPFADKLQKEASKRGREFAKKMGIGNYYKWYHDAKDFVKEGKLDNVCLPIKLPDDMGKVPVDLQIVNVTFTPTWASMDLMGTFMMPKSSHVKNEVLVLGAPHLCISPDRLLPESGAICLLSDFTLTEQDSQFEFTFKSPSDITVTNNGQAPEDGCYISWGADTLSAFMVDIEMAIPKLKKVTDAGDVTSELPKVYIKFGVRDWSDWKTSVKMDSFEADDLPGWTFMPGEMIYDHSSSTNASGMGSFPKTYDRSKVLTANKIETWQGLYIKKVGIRFPKALAFGSADKEKRLEASVDNMFFDKSGASLQANLNNIFDAVTGKVGGWGFSIKKMELNIVQNSFDGCNFSGGIGVPLLGSKDKDEKNIDYRCDIYNQRTLKGSKNKNGYTYVFKVEPRTDELALDFFLAKAKITKSQTYFLLEAEDQDDGKTETHVELCFGGVLSINGKEKISPKLPDIHFVGMRIANFAYKPEGREAWQSSIAKVEEDRKAAFVPTDSKIEFNKWKEMQVGQDCYFSAGQWSLASIEKKLGPFKFKFDDYQFRSDMAAHTVGLYLKGSLSIVDGVFDAGTGFAINAKVNIEDLDLKYDGWELDEISIGANFGVVKLDGRFDIRTSGEDTGLGGNLTVTMPGDLFKVTVDGGCFEHDSGAEDPKEGDKFTWGYFYGELDSKTGVGMDPVKITGVKFGLFFNCKRGGGKGSKVDLSNTKDAPVPSYGTIGIIAGLSLSAISESTMSGDFDMTVIYQKATEDKDGYLSAFLLNGSISGAGGLVKSKASIIYFCDDVDKYFQLNVTFETGSSEFKELAKKLDDLTKDLQELNNQFEKYEKDMKAGLDGLSGKTDKPTESESLEAKDTDTEKPKGSLKAMESTITFDFKITFRANSQNLSTPKWHVYIGEPDYEKRCKITFIDFDAKIVKVKVGANVYVCFGNELPGNGQLPPIPAEISEFLNGGSKEGVKSASRGEADKARRNGVTGITGNVKGGVMVGAQVFGFIKFDLGLISADMGVQAGFDLSLRNLSGGWCTNLNHGKGAKPGHNGWYAEGQMYAYLYAVLKLHIRLGFYNNSFNLLDAGIGGMFRCALPNPNYAVGKARIKLKLLGGLVNVNRSFSFECGEVCDMFYGNPLDNFDMWSEMSIGSERRREGWAYSARIAPELGRRPTIKTNANLNQHYRLIDENERARLEKNGIVSEDIAALASRTFIFRNKDMKDGKYVAYLYSYTDSAKAFADSLHRKPEFVETISYYRGAETTSQHLLDVRMLRPNRFYALKVVGCAKQIEAGMEVDPWTVDTTSTPYKANYTPWEQAKYYYFRTTDQGFDDFDPLSEDFNLEDYVALAYPSQHNKLKFDVDVEDAGSAESSNNKVERIYAHSYDLIFPNIALTREFKFKKPGDKMIWRQYVYDKKDGRRLYTTKDAVVKTMTSILPASKKKVVSCNIIAPEDGLSDVSNGRYNVDVDLSLDYITTRTMTRKEMVEKEKTSPTSFTLLLTKANGGAMPTQQAINTWRELVPDIRQYMSAQGVSSSGSSSSSLPPSRATAGMTGTSGAKGAGSTVNGQKVGGTSSKVGATSPSGSNTAIDKNRKQLAETFYKQWKSRGLVDNEIRKILDGLASNANMYTTKKFTAEEEIPYEVVDTINLAYLPLTITSSSWQGGEDLGGYTTQYEKPFVTSRLIDYEVNTRKYDYFPNHTDYSAMLVNDVNGYWIQRDPFFYLSWLSNYALVGGWRAQLLKYNIGVTTTESLLAVGNGGLYAGLLGRNGSRNVFQGAKDLFNTLVYCPERDYFPVRELDKPEEDVALVGNFRMGGVNVGMLHERFARLSSEALRNITDVYGLARRVSDRLQSEMTRANSLFKQKGKLKNLVSNYLEERNGLYMNVQTDKRDSSFVASTSFSFVRNYAKASVPFYQMALTTYLLDPNDIFEFEGQSKELVDRFAQDNQKKVWTALADETSADYRPFDYVKALKGINYVKVQAYRVNTFDLNSGEYVAIPDLYDMTKGRYKSVMTYNAPVVNILLRSAFDDKPEGFVPTTVADLNRFPNDGGLTIATPSTGSGGTTQGTGTTQQPVGSKTTSKQDLQMNNAKTPEQFRKEMEQEKALDWLKTHKLDADGNWVDEAGNKYDKNHNLIESAPKTDEAPIRKPATTTPTPPTTVEKVGTLTRGDIERADATKQNRESGPINTETADTTSTSKVETERPLRRVPTGTITGTSTGTSSSSSTSGSTSRGGATSNSTNTPTKKSTTTTPVRKAATGSSTTTSTPTRRKRVR